MPPYLASAPKGSAQVVNSGGRHHVFEQRKFVSINKIELTKPWVPFIALYRYGYLIRQLVRRDLNAKFRRSTLGLAWMVLSPLLLLAGYTLVFGVLLKARWGGAGTSMEFALVLYAGLIFYNFFADVIGRSPGLIYGNQPYVKKMVFPLETLNWAAMLSASVNFVISLLTWVVFALFVKKALPLTILWMPLVFLPFAIFTLGCSWLLSGYSVFHPDAEHVVPIVLLLMMFISPLFFPVESMPGNFSLLLHFNPLSYVLEEGRGILIAGRTPDPMVLVCGWGGAMLMAWLGYASFMSNREVFSDAI